MDDALIEEIAAGIHWGIWINYPEHEPYADAPEHLKDDARAMAREALTGIERAGYRLVRDAGVRTYR